MTFDCLKKICIKLLLVMSLSSFALADAKESINIDDQRPDDFSDQQWNDLKSAIQSAQLLPTPEGVGGQNSRFGSSVSIDGNRAVVSAPLYADTGAVFVYDYDGSQWIKTHELFADDGHAGDEFGHSVSLSGNRVLVGARFDRMSGFRAGAAYVFDFDGTTWVKSQKLIARDLQSSGDEFGFTVSLFGDRALIGAPNDDEESNNAGAVYIFDLIADIWQETQKLTSMDAAPFNGFGHSVSLYQDRVLIGSLNNTAHVFDVDTGGFVPTQILTPSDPMLAGGFGRSVSLHGDRALIGAQDSQNGKGSAYVFDFSGVWIETQKLVASDADNNDRFGNSVSLFADRALIGAFESDDPGFSATGAAYVYDLTMGTWNESIKIRGNDISSFDSFGNAVSLSNGHLIVGAFLDNGDDFDSGSAYIFQESGGSWLQRQKLIIDETGAAFDQFGYSVSTEGQRTVVGVIGDDDQGLDAGAVYVFDMVNEQWQLSQKLFASDAGGFDNFGFAVSLSGNRLAVSAISDDETANGSGAVYIFELNNGFWLQTTKIKAMDAAQDDQFGYSTSLQNNRLVVGARRNDSSSINAGAAYVFDEIGGNWSQAQKLIASDTANNDEFGFSVSLSLNRILIGARYNNEMGNNAGAAYLFDLNGNTWIQTVKLTASDGASSDEFGSSVSLLGNWAVVGAPREGRGAAYFFQPINGQWNQRQKIKPTAPTLSGYFGNAVSLSEVGVLIGARLDDVTTLDAGAAYLFERDNAGFWLQSEVLKETNGSFSDEYGFAVSLSSDYVVVGARFDGDRGTNAGSVFVYDIDPNYVVGGMVSGLDGSGLRLKNNGIDTLDILSNGVFEFPAELIDGTQYNVTIDQQPNNNSQTCSLKNASGTSAGSDVTTVEVNCVTNQFSIGVNVSGLVVGNEVSLLNNGVDFLQITGDGVINFNQRLIDGADYEISILNQPSNPSQTCVVNNAVGTINGQDLLLDVICTPNQFTVSVDINGLAAGASVSLLNFSELLVVTDNGISNFPSQQSDLSPYSISILSQPSDPNQVCVVNGQSVGNIAASDVLIEIQCTTVQYNIGVNVRGLAESGVLSIMNNMEPLTITSNGQMTFTTPLDDHAAYNVAIMTQPTAPDQVCSFLSVNSGNLAGQDVVIDIECVSAQYHVVVNVNGLITNSELALLSNSETLSIRADGMYEFHTPQEDYSNYTVSIIAQPDTPSQQCVFDQENQSGVIQGQNVVVSLLCEINQFNVDVQVTGLVEGNIVSFINGSDTLEVMTDGLFTVSTLDDETAFDASISTQPTSPNQQCSFVGVNSGVLAGQDIVLNIACTTLQYSIAVDVNGLADNAELVVLNGAESIAIRNNGIQPFLSLYDDFSSYAVSIITQPTAPNQVCVFSQENETGSIDGENIIVLVNCVTSQYDVNVNVMGLAETNSVSFLNGTDTLEVMTDGLMRLSTLDDHTAFDVSITTQPTSPDQTCQFEGSSSGSLAGAHVQIDVTCITGQYSVGVEVSGLAVGNSVVLANQGDLLTVSSNGPATFPTLLDDGSTYAVSVEENPTTPEQTCNVTSSATGVINSANVTAIQVECETNQYFIGGNVSGLLPGNYLILQNNGTDDEMVSGNGPYVFSLALFDESAYSVSIELPALNPIQSCDLLNASSALSGDDIIDVNLACEPSEELIYRHGFELFMPRK